MEDINMYCPECGTKNEDDSIFCQDCGFKFPKENSDQAIPPFPEIRKDIGFTGRVERSVYFKIARGFTWVVILIATIALIITSISAGGTLSTLFLKKSNGVSREDVLAALDQKNKRGQKMQVASDEEDSKVDINLLNKLNAEINNTLYLLFTKEAQIRLTEQEYEFGRQQISNELTHWKDFNERISLLKDLREKVKGIGKTKENIMEAIGFYLSLKGQKEEMTKTAQLQKYAELQKMGWFILASLIFISLATISLVLMAIERNTRKIT
jgi:hypothetical protein